MSIKVIIEILDKVQERQNAQGKSSRYQPIAVYVEGQRFPKERKYYLGRRDSLPVGKYSLDVSKNIVLQEGSEHAPPIFEARFGDSDLVPVK